MGISPTSGTTCFQVEADSGQAIIMKLIDIFPDLDLEQFEDE